VRFWLRAVVLAAVLLACLTLRSSRAFAAPEDVGTSVERILNDDVANANFGDARKKLRSLLDRCKRDKDNCSGRSLAQIHVAAGIVFLHIGKAEDAKNAFNEALNADAAASLPNSPVVTPAMKTSFAETQRAWTLANNPDDPVKAGWTNKQALEYAKQAVQADAAGNLQECIDREKAALQIEDQARGRLHLAFCEERSGKVIDALRDAQRVLASGIQRNDPGLIKSAQTRINALLPRVAKIGFDVPAGVADIKLTFDDRPVPKEKIHQKFSIDPGHHKIHAEGTTRGVLLVYDETQDVKDGETVNVKITLKPSALTEGQIACMFAAKSQEDILNCLPQDKKPLVIRAGFDIGAYTDSTSVQVLTPAIDASITAPTAGWNVGASYLIDVVSAASPDVVSTASHNFRDLRHAASLNGGYKPGNYGAQGTASLSVEHDYVSRSAGLTLLGDFLDKTITPSLGYFRSEDTIGRADTPYDVFSNHLTTNEFLLGSAIVMSPTSVLQVGGSLQSERGDQSKPYRYIPLFANGVGVPIGATFTEVNTFRLPTRPLEQLPTARDRWALAGRYIRRMGGSATLRLEERLYFDTWSTKASSTDVRYLIDFSRRLRVGPHVRLHVQTPANFYKRKYIASPNPDGSIDLPKYRTTDRELSQLLSFTGGGSARLSLSPPEDKVQFAVQLDGDAMYTRYFDALYIKSRLALWSVLRFDVEFQ
jgi:tetratricopeptide (TPR) repeat protein